MSEDGRLEREVRLLVVRVARRPTERALAGIATPQVVGSLLRASVDDCA
jgi:hypothetical protein